MLVFFKLTSEHIAAMFESIPIPFKELGESCLVSSPYSLPSNPHLVTYSSFISIFMLFV
jgi:hypothetical protein